MFIDPCIAPRIAQPIAQGQHVRAIGSKKAEELDFSPSPANVVTVHNLKWTILCAQAKHSEDAGEFVEAKDFWQRALCVTEEFSWRDSRVTQTLRNLANLHYRLGEYGEAERHSLREAEITHRTFGSNNLRSSASLNLLGAIYFAQGSFLAAELCLYQVLRVNSLFYGLDDRRTMHAAQSLAIVLGKQGKRELAVSYFLQALQISEKIDGAKGSFKAVIMSQIASV